MKQLREIFGYLLGFIMFIVGIPAIMWLASCRPGIAFSCSWNCIAGVIIGLAGIALVLMSWQSAAVWVAFVIIMSFQVSSEEKRLERDFGQEYLDYKKRTGRFTPW